MSDANFDAALLALLRRQEPRPEPLEIPDDAPELVRAWAEHEPPFIGAVSSRFEDTAPTAAIMEDFEIEPVPWLDPARSILLGSWGGGECVFGVHWTGGAPRWFQLDLEWQSYDNPPIVDLGGSEAFWRDVLEREKMPAHEVDARLAALFAAAGAPLPAPPKLEGYVFLKAERANPWERAQKLLGKKAVLASSVAGGRQVACRRTGSTTKAAVAVLEADGTSREVAWDPSVDIYGVSVDPTGRWAVLSAGALVQLDLDTLATVPLLDNVGWTCGFLDAEHIATFTDGLLAVYRFAPGDLGAPVATLQVGGSNCHVDDGRVLVIVPQGIAIVRFDGALHLEGVQPVRDRKLFYVRGVAGPRIASVSFDGTFEWYELQG